MTSVPSNPPYPLILNVDQNGNPVRLAEASAIFVSSIVALSVSAASYAGLNSVGGAPGGGSDAIQTHDGLGRFRGYNEFTYNESTQKLYTQNINVAQNSILNDVTATNLSSVTVSSDTATITSATIDIITADTLTAASLSSITVCGVNSILSSIITNNLLTTNVTATTISATNWINYPNPNNTSVIWAASSIAGYPVSANSPGAYSILVFLDGKWVASAVPTGSGGANPVGDTYYLQFKNGILLSALDTAQYDSTISGVRARGISATTYYNLPNDVSNSLSSHIASAVHWELSTLDNRYLNASGDTALSSRFVVSSITASSIYANSYSNLPSASPFWNADRLQGIAISQTTPLGGEILAYNGSVWTPSGSISLGTISATNLGGTNIVGSRVNVTDISSVTVSAGTYLNLPSTNASSLRGFAVSSLTPSAGQALVYSNIQAAWAPGYRIYQSSSAPDNLIGLEGDIYLQFNANNTFATVSGLTNASAILGERILVKEVSAANNVFSGSPYAILAYSYTTSSYAALRLDGTTLNGNRDIAPANWNTAQGKIVGSFLGSASEYFQINPYWNSPILVELPNFDPSAFSALTYPGYPDLPQDKDVLVFNENLYSKQFVPLNAKPRDYKAWTWERLSLRDGYLYDVDTEDAALNNILIFDGLRWIDSTSATLTAVSATSSTFTNLRATNSNFSSVSVSGSLLAASVSATAYRNLPRTQASALFNYPISIPFDPITPSSLLSYYDSVWQPAKDISVNSASGTTARFDNLTTKRLIATKSNVPITTSSVVLNFANSRNFEITLSSNITTLNLTNVNLESSTVEEFLLFIKYNSSTLRTILWTLSEGSFINWPSTSPPTLTCLNTKLDIFKFVTFDNGINWYGSVVGQNYTVQ
jgi:hypothetical protein